MNVPENHGSVPDTRKGYHYISGAARPNVVTGLAPVRRIHGISRHPTVVFLIPARGITTFQAQHGQKCSDRLAPIRIMHRPWLYYYSFTPPAFHEASSQATFTTHQYIGQQN